VIPGRPTALLLSVYDEYTIAYNDRSDISEARHIERMIAMGNAVTAVIVLNGRVADVEEAMKKESVEIRRNPFRELDKVDASIGLSFCGGSRRNAAVWHGRKGQ